MVIRRSKKKTGPKTRGPFVVLRADAAVVLGAPYAAMALNGDAAPATGGDSRTTPSDHERDALAANTVFNQDDLPTIEEIYVDEEVYAADAENYKRQNWHDDPPYEQRAPDPDFDQPAIMVVIRKRNDKHDERDEQGDVKYPNAPAFIMVKQSIKRYVPYRLHIRRMNRLPYSDVLNELERALDAFRTNPEFPALPAPLQFYRWDWLIYPPYVRQFLANTQERRDDKHANKKDKKLAEQARCVVEKLTTKVRPHNVGRPRLPEEVIVERRAYVQRHRPILLVDAQHVVRNYRPPHGSRQEYAERLERLWGRHDPMARDVGKKVTRLLDASGHPRAVDITNAILASRLHCQRSLIQELAKKPTP